jgi:TonB-linked SusC/RagA family outer membrane protein
LIGNQSIGSYQSLALVGPVGQGVFNTSGGSEIFTGKEPLSFPNQNLKWETTAQANLGVDLGILDNKISLTADLYLKKTFDLLLSTPIPYTSGFAQTLLNIGNVQNKGIDLDIRTINLNGVFKWNSSLNFSINRNKLTNLANDNDIQLGAGNMLREGEPIGTFFGYVFDGIFQTDTEAASSPVLKGQEPTGTNPLSRAKAGDRRYKNLNTDNVIDENDRTIIGSAEPDFIYGLNNEFNYKNFSLSFFFQGSQGNDMINLNLSNLENFNGAQNMLAEAGVNRWTPENPGNTYPRAQATGSLDNVFSSRFVEDASYLRLKNVSFGYTLPAYLLEKTGIKNIRLYATATNLWTLTKYKGYDPEGNAYGYTTNIVGVDNGNYPQTKSYTVGVQIGF